MCPMRLPVFFPRRPSGSMRPSVGFDVTIRSIQPIQSIDAIRCNKIIGIVVHFLYKKNIR